MTALAMILGVIPMAIGHTEGGEQNAPLGRAVVGGLVFGTTASLFLVPVIFAAIRRRFHPKNEGWPRREAKPGRVTETGSSCFADIMKIHSLFVAAIVALQSLPAEDIPTVRTVHPIEAGEAARFEVPGRTEPIESATIVTRASGIKTDPRVGLTSGSPPDEGGRQVPPADLCLPCAGLHVSGVSYVYGLRPVSGEFKRSGCRVSDWKDRRHRRQATLETDATEAGGPTHRRARGCTGGCRPPIRASVRLLRLEGMTGVSASRAKAEVTHCGSSWTAEKIDAGLRKALAG